MEIKTEHILGFIAIAWPALWGYWEWYWKERKIKLNITGYQIKYKKDSSGVIGAVELELYLFNYGDRPIGIAEGCVITNFEKLYFPRIYSTKNPITIMPNESKIFENGISNEGEKVEKISFACADGRIFNLERRAIKRLNVHLKNIGTKFDELEIKAAKK